MNSKDKVKSKTKKKLEVDTTSISEEQEEQKITSSFCKQPKKNKTPKEEKPIDTTFVLKDINYVSLDRNNCMKDIQDFIFKNSLNNNISNSINNNNINNITNSSKTLVNDKIEKVDKSEKSNKHKENKTKSSITNILSSSSITNISNSFNKNEIKSITTKLENLGFSDKVKEPFETIYRGNDKSNVYTTFANTTKKELINNCSNYLCWYCRNNLIDNTLPICIPLKYYNSYTECSLVHNSLINTVPKLEYKINTDTEINVVKDKEKIFYEKVNLTETDKQYIDKIDSSKSLVNCDYFEGEGIFCSFNCAVAYVYENNSIKYKNTGLLINKLYKNLFGFFPKEKILPSPSWKLLKQYGGDLTLEEYRKSFQVIDYSCNWQYLRNFPNGPVCELYLEKKIL